MKNNQTQGQRGLNSQEIIDTFNIFTNGEAGVCEVRILNTNWHTVSGYFNNADALLKAIAPYSNYNIYITLNPVQPSLLARASNRLETYCKNVTTDKDIEMLDFLLIDCDPVRPANISSSDVEHLAAENKALAIKDFLQEKGFPDPIMCDSGNGFHLVYFVGLENNHSNVSLLKNFLAALDFLFSDEIVKVDTTTYNPSRITRLYGTLNRKGDSVSDRPHRYSGIVKWPEEWKHISVELFESIIESLPKVPQTGKGKSKKNTNKDFLVSDWLDKNDIKVAYFAPFHDNGTKYVLEICPWNPDHTNKSAYVIQFKNGGICAGCHHDSCQGNDWKTLQSMYNDDKQVEEEEEEEETQSDKLIRLGSTAKYFTDETNEPYAAFEIDGHYELMAVRKRRFQLYLTKLYFDENNSAPDPKALTQALSVLEVRAVFSESEHKLIYRVGFHDEAIYYDLANKKHEIVRITPGKCEIVNNSLILFLRGRSMKSQVCPDFSVTPSELFALFEKHFRVKSAKNNSDDPIVQPKDDMKKNLILFAVYLVSCFIPAINHTILIIHGEKGAAKTTTMRLIKALVDPEKTDVLSMPTSKLDLVVTLSNRYMAAFDNLGNLSAEKSDLLCMAATGGSFSKRKLYSDDDENIISFRRCIILNGINIVTNRPDLLDRAILQELPRISPGKRKTEQEVFDEFDKDLPKMLGGIFNTISLAMVKRNEIHLKKVERMADFAYWGYAIAEVMGLSGEAFLESYSNNQSNINQEVVNANPLASAIMVLLSNTKTGIWEDSVSNLLEELVKIAVAEKINTKDKFWPESSSVLSKRLNEIKSNLEGVGITFNIRHAGSHKKITLIKKDPSPK